MTSSQSTSEQPPFLLLGRVLRPHGIRGELRIEVLTAYPERIVAGMTIAIGPDPDDPTTAVEYEITQVRTHQKYLILGVEGVPDRNAADLLREQNVMIALENAIPLEDGEFYLYQIIGLSVQTEDGETIGTVTEIIETGANDVLVVHGPRGEILLPVIDDCVLDVDVEGEKITVNLMEGLVED